MSRGIASRTIAAAVLFALLPLARSGHIAAQTPAPAQASQSSQSSAPATAEDVAKLRQTLEQLRVQLAALQRRLDAIEEQLNSLQK